MRTSKPKKLRGRGKATRIILKGGPLAGAAYYPSPGLQDTLPLNINGERGSYRNGEWEAACTP